MKYRTLDEKGDYTFARDDFLRGSEAVAQAVMTRLRLLYAEWWENIEDGLPLFEKILGRRGGRENLQAVDLLFVQRIQGTPGVKNVTDYESSFDVNSRRYQASCVVNTIYGEQEITISAAAARIEVLY